MTTNDERIIAVYPGSFDPVTRGHLDVIRRAARLFSKLIVGVGKNPDKEELFSAIERMELLRPHLAKLPNVCVQSYDGLTVDFARQCGASAIIKGIRDVADLTHEMRQANVNLAFSGGGIETVLLFASDQHVMTSSTYIKQIFEMGGGASERIRRLVPGNVADALARKLAGATARDQLAPKNRE